MTHTGLLASSKSEKISTSLYFNKQRKSPSKKVKRKKERGKTQARTKLCAMTYTYFAAGKTCCD